MDKKAALLKHLRKPRGFEISEEQWQTDLKDALRFGCDWLAMLQELNPIPAAAVEEMALRLDIAEKYLQDTLDAEDIYHPHCLEAQYKEYGL